MALRLAFGFLAALALGFAGCADGSTAPNDPGVPLTGDDDDLGAGDVDGGDNDGGDSSPPTDTDPEVFLTPAAGPSDYVIITDDALYDMARRYQTYRIQTGYRAHVVKVSSLTAGTSSPTEAAQAIRAHLASRYSTRDASRPFYALLIGDAEAGSALKVPAYYFTELDADLGFLDVASDHYYADLNEDGAPDFAIGRLPAATPDELNTMLTKVKAYEAGYAPGLWNRRINLFASTADFGDTIDTVIENFAFSVVESVSYDFDITMTYGKQSSPYVFVPERFSDKVYDRINEGALLLSYIGHGFSQGFATLRWNGYDHPLLDVSDLSRMDVSQRPPILAFIACATGAFHLSKSVSERILAEPKAPPVVISSTEVSHPIPNAAFIYELGQVLTSEHPQTLGALFLRTKERFLENTDGLRQQIALIANIYLGAGELEQLLDLHQHLYTLFGDPAMTLSLSEAAPIQLSRATAKAGESVEVSGVFGTVPEGEVTVTLETTRSTILGTLAPVPADGHLQRDSVIEQNYATANDKVVFAVTAPVANAAFSLTLNVPAALPAGNYYVKVFAEGPAYDAHGSAPLTIVP